MHIQPQILLLPVPHDEAMVAIPSASGAREERLAQGLEQALQSIHEGFQSDIAQDDALRARWSPKCPQNYHLGPCHAKFNPGAVVVHAIGPPRRQTALVEMEYLL